jgi:hypothetical protein
MSAEFLTAAEEEEYLKQVRFLDNPRWHDWGKCGQLLIAHTYGKRHVRFHRQFCQVHQVIVNMSGWELGESSDGPLRDLKKQV